MTLRELNDLADKNGWSHDLELQSGFFFIRSATLATATLAGGENIIRLSSISESEKRKRKNGK